MQPNKKSKKIIVPAIALCVISSILLVVGIVGILVPNPQIEAKFFLAPVFFFIIGIVSLVISKRNLMTRL